MIKRILAGTLTAGLLGVTPLAVSAPAQATDNLTTTITLEQNYGEPRLVYGEDISFVTQVSASDGGSVYSSTDTVTLWAMPAGTTTWTPVETLPGSGYISWTNVKPAKNTAYKATYSGATAVTAYDDNYTASESAPLTVGVARKITAPKSGFVLRGKVMPNYNRKPVIVKVSKNAKRGYKKFKVVKTTGAGKYRVVLPKRRGTWYWSVTIKGDSNYLANGYGWRTTVY